VAVVRADVLTVDEVAQYLRVHGETVRRWCRSGELKAAKVGRTYRIRAADLDAWWQEHTRVASGAATREGRG
jgi:excisionase family DNA binding protein